MHETGAGGEGHRHQTEDRADLPARDAMRQEQGDGGEPGEDGNDTEDMLGGTKCVA